MLRWILVIVLLGQFAAAALKAQEGLPTAKAADRIEWQAFLSWCSDLVDGRNIEPINDPLRTIRYKAGKHLMTEHGMRWQKAHCEKMLLRERCAKLPDSDGCDAVNAKP